MIRMRAMVVFFLLSSLAAGQAKIKISHQLHEADVPLKLQSVWPNPVDTIRILAVMVEFQSDNNEQTTGDGTFQMAGSQAQIDPPPHDSSYFRNKIRFIENYFRKVSDGKLTIEGEVLGRCIILSKHMSDYAPPTTRIDNRKLDTLAAESWAKANTVYSGIPFSRYDLFVLFHAGVGRDIDMISSLGQNLTPYDIPSLYMDSAAFAAARGAASFNGLVNGFIKNTIILPETESRNIDTDTLQLSINGMFAASVGSYLGLPDLFDTKTGRSGIGQFGLMDGAGIFAYRGLFPPEPSAWEKIQLGWVMPQLVRNSCALSLPAVGLAGTGQDVIYKIPISYSEYFLLENRNRDPEGNGQTLTIVKNGIDTYQYLTDTTANIYYDTTGISGSVVDAENFDWAVASWQDSTKKYYGGGILIWHIDDNIIQAGLKSNTVNADIDHRGVKLKEADGSKDIGQNYEEFTPEYGTEYGTPFDCWFSGNNYSPLYSNTFDGNSFPNSNSHSGAASLVTIKNFSSRSELMTVNVEIGSSVLQRDSVFNYSFGSVSNFPTSTKEHLYIPASDGIYGFKNNGSGLVISSNPVLSADISDYGVAAYKLSNNTEIAASVRDSILDIIEIPTTNGPISIRSIIMEDRFSTSPCIAYMDSLCILAGAEQGTLYKFSLDGRLISKRSVGTGAVSSIALLPASSNSYEYFFTAGNYIYSGQDSAELPATSNEWILAAAVSSGKGDYIAALEKNGNKVISFDRLLSNKNFEINTKSSAIQEAAIADIDGDGEKDIIVQSASNLFIFNRIGLLLGGFPISAKSGSEFTGTPLIVDFNGDGKPEIILLTNDGEMWVYDGSGKLLSGFPIQAASKGKAFPAVYSSPPPSNKLGIAVLSEKGTLEAFLSNTSVTDKTFYWWQHLGDERHLNADTNLTILRPPSAEFLPKSRAYNWPNPVYGRSTQIRYYTSENAAVTVTILDLSSVKITELKGRGIAGMDNEITWDVSNIQSGVYLARIEAQGAVQNSVTIIKIAVVK